MENIKITDLIDINIINNNFNYINKYKLFKRYINENAIYDPFLYARIIFNDLVCFCKDKNDFDEIKLIIIKDIKNKKSYLTLKKLSNKEDNKYFFNLYFFSKGYYDIEINFNFEFILLDKLLNHSKDSIKYCLINNNLGNIIYKELKYRYDEIVEQNNNKYKASDIYKYLIKDIDKLIDKKINNKINSSKIDKPLINYDEKEKNEKEYLAYNDFELNLNKEDENYKLKYFIKEEIKKELNKTNNKDEN